MKAKSFRVTGLPSCYHTPETIQIFEKYVTETVTKFVTLAIVEYAKKLGYTFPGSSNLIMIKPEYISNEHFTKIQERMAKSKETDYTYLVAFEYLLSQRPGVSKSNIYRDAIKNFC